MLKIIHIIPTFELGGVQTGIVYSLSELRKKYDYKVLVIGRIDWDWMNSLPAEIKENTLWSNSNSIAKGCFSSYKIIKKEKPDIVISSLWKSAPLSIAYRILNRKSILIGFFHTARFVHWINFILLKLVAKTADISITDSSATFNYVRKKYAPSKIFVIPFYFPVDAHYDKRQSPDPSLVKIAYFGRFKPEKGIGRALRFSKILRENGISFKFDLYGEGLTDKYNKEIFDLGLSDCVKLNQLLAPQKVRSVMADYDFFLQLSDNEGMGFAVAEAMICGLVPIVTPVGEIANYSSDGINAIWLEREFDNKLEDLSNKVKKIIDDPQMYLSISENAMKAFAGQKGYLESMENAINAAIGTDSGRQ